MNVHPLIAVLGIAGQTGDGATPSRSGAGVPFVLPGGESPPGAGQVVDAAVSALLALSADGAPGGIATLDPAMREQLLRAAQDDGAKVSLLRGTTEAGLDRAAAAANAPPAILAAQAEVAGASQPGAPDAVAAGLTASLQVKGGDTRGTAEPLADSPISNSGAGQAAGGDAGHVPAIMHAAAAARYKAAEPAAVANVPAQDAALASAVPTNPVREAQPAGLPSDDAPLGAAAHTDFEMPAVTASGNNEGQALAPVPAADAAMLSEAGLADPKNAPPGSGGVPTVTALPGPAAVPATEAGSASTAPPAPAAAVASAAGAVAAGPAKVAAKVASSPAGDEASADDDAQIRVRRVPAGGGRPAAQPAVEAAQYSASGQANGRGPVLPANDPVRESMPVSDGGSAFRSALSAESAPHRAVEPGPAQPAFSNALSRGAESSALHTPPQTRLAAPAPAAQQVAVQITHAAEAGSERVTVQLKPASLGTITVDLEVGGDNKLMAVIAADRQETVDLLQRDVRALERALNDAGLKTDSGSLSFNLRGDGDHRDFRHALVPQHNGGGDSSGHMDTPEGGAASARLVPEGRVDIRV